MDMGNSMRMPQMTEKVEPLEVALHGIDELLISEQIPLMSNSALSPDDRDHIAETISNIVKDNENLVASNFNAQELSRRLLGNSDALRQISRKILDGYPSESNLANSIQHIADSEQKLAEQAGKSPDWRRRAPRRK